jgi:tripartite-type tricarboxylate transporter receptor subunit TctC
MGADASSQDEVGNNGMLAKPTFLCVIVAVACAAGGIASAQTFPNRPIRIVVGFAPAGPADVMARLIGQRLTSILGQSIVIDNRPGAGGTIGARAVAESDPDGYTLLLGNTSTLVISPLIYKNVNYDPVKGFASVAALGTTSNLLIVNPALPVRSVQEASKAGQAQLRVGRHRDTPAPDRRDVQAAPRPRCRAYSL